VSRFKFSSANYALNSVVRIESFASKRLYNESLNCSSSY